MVVSVKPRKVVKSKICSPCPGDSLTISGGSFQNVTFDNSTPASPSIDLSDGATTTPIVDTYKTAIANFKFGEGAARAVIIVIILAIFSLIYLFFLNKVNKHYGVK